MAEHKSRILRIAGHDYKIRGAESDEQIRLVERCLNDKIGELKKLFSVHFLGCLRSGTAFAGPFVLIKMLIFGFWFVDNLAASVRYGKIISRLSLCSELLKTLVTDVTPIVDMFITYL